MACFTIRLPKDYKPENEDSSLLLGAVRKMLSAQKFAPNTFPLPVFKLNKLPQDPRAVSNLMTAWLTHQDELKAEAALLPTPTLTMASWPPPAADRRGLYLPGG